MENFVCNKIHFIDLIYMFCHFEMIIELLLSRFHSTTKGYIISENNFYHFDTNVFQLIKIIFIYTFTLSHGHEEGLGVVPSLTGKFVYSANSRILKPLWLQY